MPQRLVTYFTAAPKSFWPAAGELRTEAGQQQRLRGACSGKTDPQRLCQSKDDEVPVVDGVRMLGFAPSREYLFCALDLGAVLR
ncbi:hypothetical protein PpBr36_04745 [Pyricularia pennisetigena]|uniref:hypothetical protein n=1 Tax=Pyricularia pennisetigena TaxID=1578925 RepID=UPI00114F7163|nr:hypothetical protein PpBr36_04745 [Pyricularia pennisetigena]TLS26658.1 hypothetical protein PpBr36_04745 [Pyricularia pennisetigena]